MNYNLSAQTPISGHGLRKDLPGGRYGVLNILKATPTGWQ